MSVRIRPLVPVNRDGVSSNGKTAGFDSAHGSPILSTPTSDREVMRRRKTSRQTVRTLFISNDE